MKRAIGRCFAVFCVLAVLGFDVTAAAGEEKVMGWLESLCREKPDQPFVSAVADLVPAPRQAPEGSSGQLVEKGCSTPARRSRGFPASKGFWVVISQ